MARTRVKASPARARTSVPGDVLEATTWVRIALGGKSSRYVVHFHLDDGKGGELKPICGSKNSSNRKYEVRTTGNGAGEHINCTKCKVKRDRLRVAAANAAMEEARVAQKVKDIEKATQNIAKAKPRSAPPVLAFPAPTPQVPLVTLPPTVVPAQRSNGFSTSLFRAPDYSTSLLADVDDGYDDEDQDDDECFDETEPTNEEAPQMTAPTITPLTAFPARPAAPTIVAQTPAVTPEPVTPVEPVAEVPVDDDVIVVRSNTYNVILTHPVTKVKLVIEGIEAASEDEAEILALDYVEVEVETKTTRVRAPRR